MRTPHGSGLSRTLLWEIPGSGGLFFDFGGLVMDKTALGSPPGDGSQQACSNTEIESFWRWKFGEMSVFVVIGVPWGSEGRPWGVPGASPGSQGRAQGIPGIPGGSGHVPGIPWILFIKIIL